MPRSDKGETFFARRMMRILREKGFLVLNCAGAQLFDCVALMNENHYVIEFKGRKTPYPEEQMKRQIEEANRTGNMFFLIRQSKKRGKIDLLAYYPDEGSERGFDRGRLTFRYRALKKFLEGLIASNE